MEAPRTPWEALGRHVGGSKGLQKGLEGPERSPRRAKKVARRGDAMVHPGGSPLSESQKTKNVLTLAPWRESSLWSPRRAKTSGQEGGAKEYIGILGIAIRILGKFSVADQYHRKA